MAKFEMTTEASIKPTIDGSSLAEEIFNFFEGEEEVA